MRRVLRSVFAIPALMACAGNVETVVLQPDVLSVPGRAVTGVVFYAPQFVRMTYVFTMRVDNATGTITHEEGKCQPVNQKVEVAVLPDLGRPLLLRNKSGMLSAAKFAATFDRGMLASVNAEPTERASDLLTAAAAVLTPLVATSATATPMPVCNASPRLSRFERLTLE